MWFRKSKEDKDIEAAVQQHVISKALEDQHRTERLIEYVESNTNEVETMANKFETRLPQNHFVASLRLTMGEGAKPA